MYINNLIKIWINAFRVIVILQPFKKNYINFGSALSPGASNHCFFCFYVNPPLTYELVKGVMLLMHPQVFPLFVFLLYWPPPTFQCIDPPTLKFVAPPLNISYFYFPHFCHYNAHRPKKVYCLKCLLSNTLIKLQYWVCSSAQSQFWDWAEIELARFKI